VFIWECVGNAWCVGVGGVRACFMCMGSPAVGGGLGMRGNARECVVGSGSAWECVGMCANAKSY
jgi:hypothetical protein